MGGKAAVKRPVNIMTRDELQNEEMILVSACLAGCRCRYDGKDNLIPEIRDLVLSGRAVAVCPESAGGLPTPRDPGEIVGSRVLSCRRVDVTQHFQRGAEAALETARKHGCRLAVLKSKSPSCGKGLIHNGRFDGGLVEGNGITAELLMENGIRVLTEKEFVRIINT